MLLQQVAGCAGAALSIFVSTCLTGFPQKIDAFSTHSETVFILPSLVSRSLVQKKSNCYVFLVVMFCSLQALGIDCKYGVDSG